MIQLSVMKAKSKRVSIISRESDSRTLDISMLEAAGVGVAMLNATDAVKRVCDIVTGEDNDHDGLADVILRAIR